MRKCKLIIADAIYFPKYIYYILHKIWKEVKIREAQYTLKERKG